MAFLLASTDEIEDAVRGQTEAEQAVDGEGRAEPQREDPNDDPVPNQ